jgi:hypothetical protein
MLKSGGSISDANPGSDLDAIQQRTGLLGIGDTLQAARKFDLQAEVLADGKLLLNAWPRPLGIRAATNKAYEIEEWGHVPFTPKLRRQNPLTYWTYFDSVTNKDERLVRLYDLHKSSYADRNEYCPLCLEAIDWGNTIEPRGDAFIPVLSGLEGTWVAPRRHFTKFDLMPKRDEKAVQELLQAEIFKTLSLGHGVQVFKKSHATGHVYYQINGSQEPGEA